MELEGLIEFIRVCSDENSEKIGVFRKRSICYAPSCAKHELNSALD